ncbi:MAG TPA: EthD domain-containing protein [Aliidongia sp.]|uniref:EthD domain-containing protein n=1 Tax=Aliidongia sp. TaxID=1914230 RepID=UPI002DDD0310|nr:EthD domain-containing protein [Aliidongia sp.]HEV2673770.1 EthD domain-containing protein [Aliidongia sp.]
MGTPTPHPKLVYFAERHPSFDPVGFKARWRQHGALGMSLPRWRNIERYAQCDPIPLSAAGFAPLECDGVALVWYRSEATRQAHGADPAAAMTKADERETFARPVAQFALLTDEIIFKMAASGRPKLFVALRRAEALTAAAFRDLWCGAVGPRLVERVGSLDPGGGYVQNHARATPSPQGFPADCIDEIALRDPSGFLDRLRETLDHSHIVASVRCVLTQETLLHPAAE